MAKTCFFQKKKKVWRVKVKLWEQNPEGYNATNTLLCFLTSVLLANKLYSSLSQEASPCIKRTTVSWQLAHYSILLEASGLIIMVFNLKYGWCPAWLPLCFCTTVYLGLEQAMGWRGSLMQCPFIQRQQLEGGKKKQGENRSSLRLQIKQFTHNWGPWLKSSPSWELIKNVTSHKGDRKHFLFPLLRSCCHYFLRLFLSALRAQGNPGWEK